MTEEQTEDWVSEPVFALRVLIGGFARWMRDEPYWPDASFRDYLYRVSGSWGFSVAQVLHAIELADLLLGVSIVDAHHADRMLDRLETRDGLTADSLGGGGRGDQLREPCLQVDQLMIKPVIGLVGN